MKTREIFYLSNKIYSVSQLEEILPPPNFVKTNKKEEILNYPLAFDIETTSFYSNGEKSIKKPSTKEEEKNFLKTAIMYCFVFGINGRCVIGRNWGEAISIFKKISDFYELGGNRRAIVYIHNLEFEFQFMKNRFNWESVFALDSRKPVKAICDLGIEFRCSYKLTNYSLEKVAENLNKYKVSKKVGDLDYSLFRHEKTPLTDKELGYVLNDGLVVMAHIQEEIERLGNISRIPLTNTGYIRKLIRNSCLYEKSSHKKGVSKFLNYRKIMNSIQIKSVLEYTQLKRAFHGGFTHSNAFYSGHAVNNVSSYDFTSSYPAVMLSEKFPMGNGELRDVKNKEEFEKYLKCYCCVFDLEISNVKAKKGIGDHFLSGSKCFNIENAIYDNGRIVNAKRLQTTLTNVDFEILRKCYDFTNLKIRNFRTYIKDYLPRDFLLAILDLYEKKTTLKGVEGFEVEYMHAKNQLNSCFGMCVTDIAREQNEYKNGEWISSPPDIEKSLNDYNNKKNRFLAYQWGVFVTAYASANLWTGILEFGENDYLYSDTDSLKVINRKRHEEYIKRYNEAIERKIKKCLTSRNIPIEKAFPKNKDGKICPLGVWDFEGDYLRFKSLGAKRYLTETKDGIKITIAGVNKKTSVPWLLNKSKKENKDPFEIFKDGLYIDESGTGKLLHSYIDETRTGILTDYTGRKYRYNEFSGVHLEATSYDLSLSSDYIRYLLGVKEE